MQQFAALLGVAGRSHCISPEPSYPATCVNTMYCFLYCSATAAASEFVECVTDDLLGQSVFVFTPSGEVCTRVGRSSLLLCHPGLAVPCSAAL